MVFDFKNNSFLAILLLIAFAICTLLKFDTFFSFNTLENFGNFSSLKAKELISISLDNDSLLSSLDSISS